MNENLEKIVDEAGTAYSEGKYEEARELYEKALEKYPTNGILHANLSAILLKIGLAEKSLEHSSKAVEMYPHWGKAYYRKGESLRCVGRNFESLISFCHGIRIDPTNCQILSSLKSQISLIFDDFPWTHLRELKFDENVEILLSTVGQQMLKMNKFEEAVNILNWSLELNLKSVKVRESVKGSLASAYCGCEKYQKAIEMYFEQLEETKLLDDFDGIMKIREAISCVAEICEEHQIALEQRKLRVESGKLHKTEIDEENLKIGILFLKIGETEQGIQVLENCGKNAELRLESQMLIGFAHILKKEYKLALSYLIPISRNIDNQSIELIESINNCMMELFDFRSSIEFLTKMIGDNRTDFQKVLHFYGLLCRTQIIYNNLPTALKIAKYILKNSRSTKILEKFESTAYRLLAIIYEHQKDDGSAIILWKQFLDSESISASDRVEGLLQIGRLAMNEAKNENAQKYFDEAIEIARRHEKNAEFVASLSAKYRWLLTNQKKLDEAKEILNQMEEMLEQKLESKSRSLIFEDLAMFVENSGRGTMNSTEAVVWLEKSLEEAQDSHDLFKEVEIYQKIGQILLKQNKLRHAEKYFCQQLEAAKELRNAKMMGDAHSNIAKLKWESKSVEDCGEHCRRALTLFRIGKEFEKKIEMFILLSNAEIERENEEIALKSAEKAILLAEDCESDDLLAKAYRNSADLNQKINKNQLIVSDQ